MLRVTLANAVGQRSYHRGLPGGLMHEVRSTPPVAPEPKRPPPLAAFRALVVRHHGPCLSRVLGMVRDVGGGWRILAPSPRRTPSFIAFKDSQFSAPAVRRGPLFAPGIVPVLSEYRARYGLAEQSNW